MDEESDTVFPNPKAPHFLKHQKRPTFGFLKPPNFPKLTAPGG